MPRDSAFQSLNEDLLRRAEVGSLEYGKKMDLILCDVPNYPSLVYHFGVNPIKHVIKNGKVVVRDGKLV
jgi:imidazolonepropionase